ncbi:unnamed protein product [Spirodela intermedia]|uniref:Dof zinc finger protein n=1 Tax=Spirodela intermedia TaxID=51605 RepID=A0A7I8K886_SPIIN|nr:unnamed protein product [Spirodela intermedia]
MMTPAPGGSVHGPEGSNTTACSGGASPRPPEQGLKCPRCDSYNTKFCYYNNYSLTQPRHFCKACRRYWTKGGALRNVPFGGGSRKTRKSRSMASLSSSTSSFCLSSDLHGRAMQEPSFFQFGGYNAYSTVCGTSGGGGASQILPFRGISSSAAVGASATPLVVLDCPAPAVPFFSEMGCRGETATTTSEESMGSIHRNLATSIESLSSINQDLHWKLQQQRLAMFFGSEGHHPTEGTGGAAVFNVLSRHHPPASFLFSSSRELSASGARGGGATGYFLENSTDNTATVDDNSFAAPNDWTGTATWSDVHPFGALR